MNSANGSGLIRVLVSAASAIRRGGIEAIIKSAPSLKLVGSTYQESALPQLVSELQPDILVWDVVETNSSQHISAVAAPDTCQILLLADSSSPNWMASALRSRVRGILPRDASAGEIIPAIHAIHAGLTVLEPEIIGQLVTHMPVQENFEARPTESLTPRESDVLRMLAEGMGNKEIAAALSISEHTVKFHVSSILDKLGADTRTEAVTQGLRQGLLVL